MTDQERKAMEMALEAFQSCRWDCDENNDPHKTFNDILVSRASEALHAALAQPEQEPVAWKSVVGYEEFYEVSSVGDLRDTKTKKIKSKSLMGAGYVKADLWANGARKQTSMHRLVAEAFLIPTGNANEVNHKNGIKTDNRVENLEWVTRSDNVNHSYYELNNQVKPISATHIETGNTLYYPSVEAAVRDGFCSAHISSVIAGRRKHHKGFVFKEAAPSSKPWVSLSDEDITRTTGEVYGNIFKAPQKTLSFARAIEAALRSKNNG